MNPINHTAVFNKTIEDMNLTVNTNYGAIKAIFIEN
jgi:hypothetical protein